MLRRTISLLTLFSFITLIITSIMLYVMPTGRVAYWADWACLGLDKEQWDNLHTTGGLLFLASGLWHTCLNWKPLIHYLKKGMAMKTGNPAALLASLVILLFVYAGTLAHMQPMEQVLVWGGQIKDRHAEVYGNPPYGHAELSSLEKFCAFLQVDVEKVVQHLRAEKLKGDISRQTVVLDIARTNNLSPQQLYALIRKAEASADPFSALPGTPPEGTGKQTLQVFCQSFGLPVDEAVKRLAVHGIAAGPEDSFVMLAQRHNMAPHEVYALLLK